MTKQEMVYRILREIPKGMVVTYGDIANAIGNKFYARYVGSILHNNPDGGKNPCYKVVNAKGELSASYAFGGIDEQKRLLVEDGVPVKDYKILNLEKYKYHIKQNQPSAF